DTKILNVDEEHGEEVSNMMALKERTIKLDEGQDGSDLGMTPKSQPSPERELMEEDQARSDRGQSHVAHAEPNPEPMNKDFIAIVYPKVHEILKLTTKEQVYIENPPSSSETFSSMKNLEDTFTFGDQFLNDKSTEEEPRKANDKTTQALASRVYKLEHHDLYSKIGKQVNEVIKEAIHSALQAPLRKRFRDLS
nr:hypothetical protein [Tanacetum cinerariifolium]